MKKKYRIQYRTAAGTAAAYIRAESARAAADRLRATQPAARFLTVTTVTQPKP